MQAFAPRLRPDAPRLQPYVPRLQPYAPRLQPYVPRLQPYVSQVVELAQPTHACVLALLGQRAEYEKLR